MRMVFDLLSSSVVRVESSMWQGEYLHSFKNIYVARRNPRRRRDAAEIVEEFVVAKQISANQNSSFPLCFRCSGWRFSLHCFVKSANYTLSQHHSHLIPK
uniref:Ovule protein n=1 Tax=Heterorhabditis bacteriophora TaxID=37862 RepID=A0A1I7WEN5_HETBA